MLVKRDSGRKGGEELDLYNMKKEGPSGFKGFNFLTRKPQKPDAEAEINKRAY